MVKIGLGLGSNISPRKHYITEAIKSLQKFFSHLVFSSLYQTIAYGNDKQQDYYNLVVILVSKKQPAEILRITKKIEQELGRKLDRQKSQPRTIDIDILFYGNQSMQTKNLVIPHYDLYNRDFFLEPLLELVNAELPSNFSKKILQQALRAIPIEKKTYPKKIPIDF